MKCCQPSRVFPKTAFIPAICCTFLRSNDDERWSPGGCAPAGSAASSSPQRHRGRYPYGPYLRTEDPAPASPRVEMISVWEGASLLWNVRLSFLVCNFFFLLLTNASLFLLCLGSFLKMGFCCRISLVTLDCPSTVLLRNTRFCYS